ncbi:MAG TPA: methyltransferase domain-containing protein [Candidatus Binatia bacterium]|nr:methyltransferase domain-containing protein [Candidatus Binatia bacterium]
MTKRRWFLQRWLLRRWFRLSGLLALLVSTGWFVSDSGGLKTSRDVVLAQAQQPGFESKKIVPFVPTPQEVVEGMLELAQVKKGDVVYDLGSGDGRIVIAAAKKYGARAVGFEIDPELIKQSRESIRKEGLEKLAEILEQDILTVDLSRANVLTMYLLPSVNLKLRPKILSEMAPGSRIVSHAFDMGDWKPDKVVQIDGRDVYYWTVPQRGSFRN